MINPAWLIKRYTISLARTKTKQTTPMNPHYGEAVADLIEGVGLVDLWGRMGWADIRRRYRRTMLGPLWSSFSALSHVSLMIRDGDRLGIVGHNGAGKTTLLRVLAGIYAPTSGRIRIDGR